MTGAFCLVHLTQGKVAKVSPSDYQRVIDFGKWSYSRRDTTGYARTYKRVGKKKITIYLHRFITGAPDSLEVDHEDNDGLNCVRSNLRVAARSFNAANRRHFRGAVEYMGVDRTLQGRYRARVGGEERKYLGTFDTKEEAARARDVAAIELYGPFAVLNFPRENYRDLLPPEMFDPVQQLHAEIPF